MVIIFLGFTQIRKLRHVLYSHIVVHFHLQQSVEIMKIFIKLTSTFICKIVNKRLIKYALWQAWAYIMTMYSTLASAIL